MMAWQEGNSQTKVRTIITGTGNGENNNRESAPGTRPKGKNVGR